MTVNWFSLSLLSKIHLTIVSNLIRFQMVHHPKHTQAFNHGFDRTLPRLNPRSMPTLIICSLLFILTLYFTLYSIWKPFPFSFDRPLDSIPRSRFHIHREDISNQNLTDFIPDSDVLRGSTIMPKMGNATAK